LATILNKLITSGNKRKNYNRATILFNEGKYLIKRWSVITYTGFFTTLPMLRYHRYKEKYHIRVPRIEDIISFIKEIFDKVKPPLECAVVAFIYIEKIIVALSFNF